MSSAEIEKDLGNTAYKNKDFESAISHYDKAISSDPTCITFYTNKAAVYFELAKYNECIELCKNAVEIGRINVADYRFIAKAFARIGHSYEKLGDLDNAKLFYDKSLTESKQPDVEKISKNLGKRIKERAKFAYINPELAESEKTKGNNFFQNGAYPEALKHYTEAINRNPDDPKLYSNRAACYTKLMEFPLAVSDCNVCIEKDPKFIKGYLRKGAACVALKDFNNARKAYRKALDIDPNCSEAKEGLMQSYSHDEDPEEARKRAVNDPEVASILSDPAMRIILQQMSDPTALREHLANPEIAGKLTKLIEAGLISFR